MKIALVGSAPSSVGLAPYGDPSWKIWGCSPGVYYQAGRIDSWFELHRWEPGVVGKPATQKPWFTPEYVQWMGLQKDVVMFRPVPEVPNSRAIEWQALCSIYGAYFFNSSLSWMAAMAMEEIKQDRAKRDPAIVPSEPDAIGFWGVDMSATEEYGYQRAGCQFFIQMARNLDIDVVVPDESDLLRHPPLYGISEHWPQHIKSVARQAELNTRLAAAQQGQNVASAEIQFLRGAISDLEYHMGTWLNLPDIPGFHVPSIYKSDDDREPVKTLNPSEPIST